MSHGTVKVTNFIFFLSVLYLILQTNARLFRKFIEAKKLRPHKTCALMMQLRGREIRTSEVEATEDPRTGQSVDYIDLKAGQKLYLNCDNAQTLSNHQHIYCNWTEFPKQIRPNDLIYIDDGKLIFLVLDNDDVFYIYNHILNIEENTV